jgi:hypothetical protein
MNKSLTPLIAFCVFFGFLISKNVTAQFFSPGARATAMGGAASTNNDLWATNNNVGALGFLEQSGAGLYYENRFILPETSSYGLNFAYTSKKAGVFGLALSRFGYKLFNRNAVGVRYARSFGPHISAGVGVNYHYIFIGNGYGNASAVSAEIGILGRVNKELSLSFHLVNPVRMNITRFQNEKLPMVIRFGISYNWASKVLTSLEVDADPEQKPNIKFGIEYKPVPLFILRGGFSSRPLAGSFGFGFDYKILRLDLAAAYHQQLGFSPQVGMSISFGKKVKYQTPAPRKKTKRKD